MSANATSLRKLNTGCDDSLWVGQTSPCGFMDKKSRHNLSKKSCRTEAAATPIYSHLRFIVSQSCNSILCVIQKAPRAKTQSRKLMPKVNPRAFPTWRGTIYHISHAIYFCLRLSDFDIIFVQKSNNSCHRKLRFCDTIFFGVD